MQLFSGKITSTTEAEALAAMQYIQTNYGTNTESAAYNSETRMLTFRIKADTFNAVVAMVQAFKTQFGSRLATPYYYYYKA